MDARLARWALLYAVAIGAEDATTHARVAGEIHDGHPTQPQGPGREQVEGAVPGEVIDSGGGLEEGDWPPGRSRRISRYDAGETRDADIVQPADNSTHEALGHDVMQIQARSWHGRASAACTHQSLFRS